MYFILAFLFKLIRCIVIIMIILTGIPGTYAQKPAIDPKNYDNWIHVSSPGISNNGKFAFYKVKNEPIGSETLIIKAIDSN